MVNKQNSVRAAFSLDDDLKVIHSSLIEIKTAVVNGEDNKRTIERLTSFLGDIDIMNRKVRKLKSSLLAEDGVYMCCLCHSNPVDPELGIDTCSACVNQI